MRMEECRRMLQITSPHFFCIIRSEMIRAGLPSSVCRVAGSKMMPLWGKVTASALFFRS